MTMERPGTHNQITILSPRFEIEVARWLRLSPFDVSDAPELAGLIDANREHLQLTGMPFEQLTEEQIGANIPVTHQAMERDERVSLGVICDGALVGAVSLVRDPSDPDVAEPGIWLTEDYSGRGIGPRAMEAIMQWGFDNWGVGRMRLRIHPENERSLRMAEKLGTTHRGMIPPWFFAARGRSSAVDRMGCYPR